MSKCFDFINRFSVDIDLVLLKYASLSLSAKTKTPQRKQAANGQITALPLNPMDRTDFIETANEAFEDVMERIEPGSPDLAREVWDVEDYVDTMLTPDMLPINKGYALSLVEDFLVHHLIDLEKQADRKAAKA